MDDSELAGALGKYRIDGVLGKGAMGIVYKAYDPHIERTVALKTIRKELFSELERAELVGRFRNEAQAGGRLSHPNIVTVFDYGEDRDVAYIAMEFVEGASLAALMAPGKATPLPQAIAWMSDLLHALGFAHARGVVHRDIKPANLLVTRGGALKISDFGVARIETSALTHTGSMVGTPSYMSPEQFRGETVDGRSDLFSAGIVLYQLLTGARPFSGAAHTVMHQILNDMPPPPSQVMPALGESFDAVVAKALAKSAGERFGSAQEFLDALTNAHGGRDVVLAHVAPADDDNTVLAGQAGAIPAIPAREVPGAGSAGGKTDSIPTTTPWKLAAMPELEALLSHQIGPMAKLLVGKAAAHAQGVDDLATALAEHIPSPRGREQFQNAVAGLKKKLDANGVGLGVGTASVHAHRRAGGTSVGSASIAAAPLATVDVAFADAAVRELTVFIGPIARVLARRIMQKTSSRTEFLRLLAEQIEAPRDRASFMAAMDKR